jgi:hypothetical protein
MRIANELTIQPRQDTGADVVPTSEILLNGRSTQRFVSGAVLEAAVQWENNFLLFITDDVPYEEMLRIVLLDQQLKIVDSALIGGPYATGSFSSLQLHEPNRVAFRFIGDTDWAVELLRRSRLRLPFLSEPAGVCRAFGFSRHFIVHGNPHPQDALQHVSNGGK